ncbi:MAG: acyltransferase [Ruminococcus sp.]|nr:acyltransferase [Ruminococcus sp.]
MNHQKFPRRHYLDNLRWMTVILVVIYHTLMMYSSVIPLGTLGESGMMYPTDSIMYFLYPWFMVLLFIISGISARSSLTNHPGDKAFLKKRTIRYLVPSTLGLFAFQWIQGYISMKLCHSFENLGTVPKPALYLIMSVSGTGVLWYLQTLWIFSLVLVIIRKITKKREKLYPKTEHFPFWGMLLLMIPALGFAQILNLPIVVYRLGLYGFAFFVGYYLFAHEEAVEKLSGYSIPLLIISVLAGIGYTIFFWGQNFADEPVLNHPFSIAYAWMMCLSLLGFGRKYLNFQNPATAWFSSKSFGLYVFHYLGMSASAYLLHEYTSLPFVLCGVLSLISSFGIGWGLYEIISRIPVFRWLVLGIRKERSNTNVQ